MQTLKKHWSRDTRSAVIRVRVSGRLKVAQRFIAGMAMNVIRKSVKRTTETRVMQGDTFSRPLSRTAISTLVLPAVNCWAIIIRPLRGLVERLFVQSWYAKSLRLATLAICLCATTLPSFAQGVATTHSPLKILSLSEPLTIAWRYDSRSTINLTPASDGERVYLPLAGGEIVSLKAADGQFNWRSEMGGELSASPVADNHGVYVASETGKPEAGERRATGALRALGREGGVTLWMRTLAMPLRGSLTLSNGKLFGGGSDGKLYAFDSTTGAVKWSYDYGAAFNSQPVISGSRVYIGSEDGNQLAFDEATGKLIWSFRTKGPVRGPVATSNELVYFGSGDGYVYALTAASGRVVWRSRTGAGVQAVVMVGEELLAASLDNFVYKFSLAGTRLWKRQLPGRISSQPLMASMDALFMPLSSSVGVVLEMKDGRQVNSLPVGAEITTSASPIAVGEAVLLTTEQGLIAFTHPRETPRALKQ